MLRLVVFEIQVQCDEWPIAMVTVPQRLLHYGANPLEEILLHGWLRSVGRLPMSHNGPAAPGLGIGMPGQILLNGEWSPCGKRAVDTIAPPLKVRVTVMRIHHCARSRSRLLSAQRGRANHKHQQSLD